MSKKNHDTHRGDLLRQMADIQAQLDNLTRNKMSAEEIAKKRQELLQTLTDLKKQIVR